MDTGPEGARRPGWLSDELFPFESHFIEIDGHLVHYVDAGAGPTLLLLHGNPTWSFVYRDVIRGLRDDFRCVALDYPGFGLSTAAPGYRFTPDEHAHVVRSVIEQLDLSGVTLVMQDWGGPIGVAAAASIPQRISGLVVANTWAWPVNGDLHFEFFSRAMGGLMGRELIRRFNLFVNAMLPSGHRRRRLSKVEKAHYRAALATRQRRHASAVFPQAITGSRTFLTQVERDLDTLAHLPALIIWADADIAFRERERQRWEATLPHSTTTILRGTGHYLQSDAPTEFAEAIRHWATTHEPPAQDPPQPQD